MALVYRLSPLERVRESQFGSKAGTYHIIIYKEILFSCFFFYGGLRSFIFVLYSFGTWYGRHQSMIYI